MIYNVGDFPGWVDDLSKDAIGKPPIPGLIRTAIPAPGEGRSIAAASMTRAAGVRGGISANARRLLGVRVHVDESAGVEAPPIAVWRGGPIAGVNPGEAGKSGLKYVCIQMSKMMPTMEGASALKDHINHFIERVEGAMINAGSAGTEAGQLRAGELSEQLRALSEMDRGDASKKFIDIEFVGGIVVAITMKTAAECGAAECPTQTGCYRWWWLVALGLGGLYLGSRTNK